MFRVAFVAVACVLMTAGFSARQLPLEPPKESGVGITPAFEGWYQNPDGTYTLLLGYFNRNTKQVIDVPIGPNNRIEPGGPDLGQPTYFETRRQWGVFTIKVPADFGNKRYTWTIVANGKTASIPVGLIKDYQVEPYKDMAMGNEPPTIKFEENGKPFQGPPMTTAASYNATVGTPLTLTVWVADDLKGEPDAGAASAAIAQRQPPVRLSWHKFRGPGDVTFADANVKIDAEAGGKATTTATFSAAGNYVLRAQVNDRTGDGGGGFQCCWTNAHVKVTVAAAASSK
jgi:hypothetical protein